MKPLICLIGFMGAGKTSVGKELSQLTGWRFLDLDTSIERAQGATVAEIFSRSGEQAFRLAESHALRAVLKDRTSPLLLAVGGGAFVSQENQSELRSAGATIVFLNASLAQLWQRVNNEGPAVRPLLGDRGSFARLYESRLHQFRKADLEIDTGSSSIHEVATKIVSELHLKK